MEKRWHDGVIPILSIEPPPPKRVLGIDVAKHHDDIRKIFLKHFAQRLTNKGIDPFDVLQEVYRGILIRNKGKCPFDPEKSALSTYVMMVSSCVTANYYKKDSKTRERETYIDDEDNSKEVSNDQVGYPDPEGDMVIRQVASSLYGDLRRLFTLLIEGLKESQIAKAMGWSNRETKRKIEALQCRVAPMLGIIC